MVSVLSTQAGSGGLLGPAPRRHFCANSCFSTKGNTFGVYFQLKRPPAKQQGPGSQRKPRPSLAYVYQRAMGEKGQRCFAEQSCICAAVGSPRRVKLYRMQLSEPRFEPRVSRRLGAEVASWLWEESWGLRPECIFQPTPASPGRGRHLEWISSSGDHQQSSRAKGDRGSPVPHWPMRPKG